MSVTIRLATKEDYAALLPIGLETQEKHADAHPEIFRHGVAGLPEDYFLEHIESETQAIYVAEVAGSVVGYVLLKVIDNMYLDMLVPRRLVYITDIAVLKTHQKQGIGHLLFQQSVEWAKDKGAASLDLTVWEFNQEARAFYERNGMGTLTRQMTLPL
ncbi:MAG: GNAT family N-acetyltransferase [Ktedonobacteraceae bacterium]